MTFNPLQNLLVCISILYECIHFKISGRHFRRERESLLRLRLRGETRPERSKAVHHGSRSQAAAEEHQASSAEQEHCCEFTHNTYTTPTPPVGEPSEITSSCRNMWCKRLRWNSAVIFHFHHTINVSRAEKRGNGSYLMLPTINSNSDAFSFLLSTIIMEGKFKTDYDFTGFRRLQFFFPELADTM